MPTHRLTDTMDPGEPLDLALRALTYLLEMSAWTDGHGHLLPRIGAYTQTGTPSRLLQRLWIDQRAREYRESQTG